jgi:hypothetical protein
VGRSDGGGEAEKEMGEESEGEKGEGEEKNNKRVMFVLLPVHVETNGHHGFKGTCGECLQ